MKVHNAYGYGLFTGGLGAHAGAEALGCTVIPMSGGQTERQIQLIQDFEPDVILATPTYLLTIADAMAHMGIDPTSTSLKYAVLGAEPWTQEMRHELEVAMNIKACDIYGLSEVMGPGVAGECVETQDGSHIWEDHFRPEIIDPFNPRPARRTYLATANTANWSSPRSPRKRCRSSGTAPRTSPACSPALPARHTDGWAASPAAATT